MQVIEGIYDRHGSATRSLADNFAAVSPTRASRAQDDRDPRAPGGVNVTYRKCIFALLALLVLGVGAARLAPYLYAESWPVLHAPATVSNAPVKVAKGRMVDDYFLVEAMGQATYAIGEPRYYQANYSYLIVGNQAALLFDAGSGTRDIRSVVAALTKLPVTIVPSHLHFDHIAGVHASDRIALVDLPSTRRRMENGRFRPGRYEFLGMFDGLTAPEFPVDKWITPGGTIDLGGRTLRLLSTPGHTPHSVALYDAAAKRLFTGDYIYPTMLYAFLPGANLAAYRHTAAQLLRNVPQDTQLWTAHCCRRGSDFAAPWLTMGDLADLETALVAIQSGTRKSKGYFPSTYRVNRQMDIGTTFTGFQL